MAQEDQEPKHPERPDHAKRKSDQELRPESWPEHMAQEDQEDQEDQEPEHSKRPDHAKSL
jgi:hypothetical protein